MLKKALLALVLTICFYNVVFSNPQENSSQNNTNSLLEKYVKLDDVGVLRLLYPNQSLSYQTPSEDKEKPSREIRYQVGDIESHQISVLSRTIGKFTQAETEEVLAFIAVESGNDPKAPYPTGTYAVLFNIDKNGVAQKIAQSANLYKKGSPFTTDKAWQPALITDIDFDKQDDLIMLQTQGKGDSSYTIYRWDGKDFSQVPNHPALALLSFYANLTAAVQLGITEEAANAKLNAAYETLSAKMQGQQTIDSLRRRFKEIKAVELNTLKVMIKSETSALLRIQFRLIDTDATKQTFEGDYQIRRFDNQWLVDNERLKSINLTLAK
ncbi:MAG: hypothetical protein IPK14_26960 [Blastocatellia bacterium]|nr:hypothetical protein [Blastocatellia bacterium]MBL8194923.1 hypothetical protein [Blastocatellia bacterium]MBN8725994.1 hypothetical protein [Acidobacteriota bacterium]